MVAIKSQKWSFGLMLQYINLKKCQLVMSGGLLNIFELSNFQIQGSVMSLSIKNDLHWDNLLIGYDPNHFSWCLV